MLHCFIRLEHTSATPYIQLYVCLCIYTWNRTEGAVYSGAVTAGKVQPFHATANTLQTHISRTAGRSSLLMMPLSGKLPRQRMLPAGPQAPRCFGGLCGCSVLTEQKTPQLSRAALCSPYVRVLVHVGTA